MKYFIEIILYMHINNTYLPSTSETYESIHINGDFDKLVSNLLLIKKLMSESESKIKYGLKFLLMKNNYKQMADIYDFVRLYGFNHVYIKRPK